jgi:GNAT superfamily N-acetyltransferase
MSELQAPVSSQWLIRAPHESEFPAIRMLLPGIAAYPAGCVFRLAVGSEKPSIRGALAYADHSQSIGNVRLHVVKNYRRQGVGSSLLNYVLDEARRLGRTRVVADVDIRKEPCAEAFLTACGFHKAGQVTSVRGPLVGRGPNAALFQKSLAKAQELPPDSRIVKIGEAPVDQIAALFLHHVANVPLLAEMHRALQPESYKESIVVMSGGRIIGFLLASVHGNCVHVPALVVVPEYRGRGLTIRMIGVLEDHLDPSVDQGQFDFTEAAAYTAKLAAEFGHEILRVAVRFERNLENRDLANKVGG